MTERQTEREAFFILPRNTLELQLHKHSNAWEAPAKGVVMVPEDKAGKLGIDSHAGQVWIVVGGTASMQVGLVLDGSHIRTHVRYPWGSSRNSSMVEKMLMMPEGSVITGINQSKKSNKSY